LFGVSGAGWGDVRSSLDGFTCTPPRAPALAGRYRIVRFVAHGDGRGLRGRGRRLVQLRAALEAARSHNGTGMASLRADSGWVVSVDPGTKTRALLILDALFKELSTRGHIVRFTAKREEYGPHRHRLELLVAGESL